MCAKRQPREVVYQGRESETIKEGGQRISRKVIRDYQGKESGSIKELNSPLKEGGDSRKGL